MQTNAKKVLTLAKLARVIVRKIIREQDTKKKAAGMRGKPSLADIERALGEIVDTPHRFFQMYGKQPAVLTIDQAKFARDTVRKLLDIKEQTSGEASLLFAEDTKDSRGTPSLVQMEMALSEIVRNAQSVEPRRPEGERARADWRMKC